MAEALAEMQREFGLREDIKLKVEATSMQPDSKRIEVEVGDKDGELRTVYKCNTTAAELKRLKYTGYQGGFETFGEPAVSKTDIAHVEGEDGSSGSYLIKKLEVSFGAGGYRQKI
ncbi:MAG: hypothetical protein LBS63_05690, partial [Prevotellaceae bacterium]|nr:hypothetical protein [Prevotellaceae bacterium]